MLESKIITFDEVNIRKVGITFFENKQIQVTQNSSKHFTEISTV